MPNDKSPTPAPAQAEGDGTTAAPPPKRGNQQPKESSDDILVEALANGLTYAEAGTTIGVVARTVSRRLEDPEFTTRVARRKMEIAEETKARIRRVASARVSGVLRAQEVLLRLLDAEDPRVQLAAARELHSTHHVVTAIDVEERIMKAEAQRGLDSPGSGTRGFRL